MLLFPLLSTALLFSTSITSALALALPAPRGLSAENLNPHMAEVRATRLEKPIISPPFPDNRVQEKDLQKELKPKRWVSMKWHSGYLPRMCLQHAEINHVDPSKFEVRYVYFEDCVAPWPVCRHVNAKESWRTILQTLGKVPVGMRQYASHIVILAEPHPEHWGAYVMGTVITVFPGSFTLGVLMHEFSHILDLVVLQPYVADLKEYPPGTSFSATRQWAEAIGNDTAVPTDYARTNVVEDFADVGRWAISDLVHRGGVGKYTRGWVGFKHQMYVYERLLCNIIFPKKEVCTIRAYDTSDPVAIGELQDGDAKPNGTLHGTMLNTFVVPPEANERIHMCYPGSGA
ncbi:hypothetical protein B0T19DRAFT_438686 [Cercophora scortea]|uniref:Uncharacterized protein n=1 Tax=Cercophora scortea TaxID=314031 RepID=A0AAE0MHE1_9PEZI|nr:hypothetical protein B0T19DRAFT_438686 [Cercophora scortea]